MVKRIMRRAIGAVAGLCLGAAAAMAQPPAAPEGQIVIDNFAFSPPTLTVKAGTRVTWVNKDEEPHTVMSAGAEAPFKSPALDTNDTFSVVFDKPGAYNYFCTIHAHMTGTIVVQ